MVAAKQLGNGVRVVSMPWFERFDRQSAEYREEVLPNSCRRRVAIEAGVPHVWYRYVGLDGKVVGLHRFGLSGPGAEVMKALGIDAEHVVAAAKALPTTKAEAPVVGRPLPLPFQDGKRCACPTRAAAAGVLS